MLIGKVIGYTTKFDYTSKTTGETFPAVKVAISFEDSQFIGVDAVSCFLRVGEKSTAYDYEWLDIGVPVIPEYSRSGKLIGLCPVDSLINKKS